MGPTNHDTRDNHNHDKHEGHDQEDILTCFAFLLGLLFLLLRHRAYHLALCVLDILAREDIFNKLLNL